MWAKIKEKIIFNPELIRGVNDMFCFEALARTFDRPDLGHGYPDWHMLFEIPGGKDVPCLPERCPSVGTVIIVFHHGGRINRYEVTGSDQISVCYSDFNWSSYSYALSWKCNSIGVNGQWRRDENYATLGAAPICRLVLVEPPA